MIRVYIVYAIYRDLLDETRMSSMWRHLYLNSQFDLTCNIVMQSYNTHLKPE